MTPKIKNTPWPIAFKHVAVGKTVAFVDEHDQWTEIGFTDGTTMHFRSDQQGVLHSTNFVELA